MSATATFHARRLSRPVAGRARAFAGEADPLMAPMALDARANDVPKSERDQKVTSDGYVWEWDAWTVGGEEPTDDILLYGVHKVGTLWAAQYPPRIISDAATKAIIRKKTVDAATNQSEAAGIAGTILDRLKVSETKSDDPAAVTLPAAGTASAPSPAPAGSPAPASTPEAAPPATGSEGGPPGAGGGEKGDIPWGYIAAGFGGVVVVGGIIYFATRK